MVDDHVRAWLGEQTLPSCTGADLELLVAGGSAEVGGRAAYVVDVSFKARHLRDLLRFFEYGLMAARGDDAPLQERDRTEGAGTKTSARVCDRELNLLNGGNAAERVIIRMPGALEGQGVGAVELLSAQRRIRLGLDDIAVAVLLADGVATVGILLIILSQECLAVLSLALYAVLVGRDLNAAAQRSRGHVADPSHLRAFPCLRAAAHPVCGDEDGTLAHAEHQQVGGGIRKDAGEHAIIPVIVVCEAAQRCFNAAHGNRNIAIRLADEPAVYGQRAVGTS